MMAKITIYGASDDLLEVEGDITEEFNPDTDGPSYLSVSDGTMLTVIYDEDGCWRITPFAKGSASMTKTEAEGADTDNYSDRVTLEGDAIRWVALGKDKATRK
jgi:hypothetical protein